MRHQTLKELICMYGNRLFFRLCIILLQKCVAFVQLWDPHSFHDAPFTQHAGHDLSEQSAHCERGGRSVLMAKVRFDCFLAPHSEWTQSISCEKISSDGWFLHCGGLVSCCLGPGEWQTGSDGRYLVTSYCSTPGPSLVAKALNRSSLLGLAGLGFNFLYTCIFSLKKPASSPHFVLSYSQYKIHNLLSHSHKICGSTFTFIRSIDWNVQDQPDEGQSAEMLTH